MATVRIECPECGGTGIFQGKAECDGAFVVCRRCHGKGYTDFKYKKFNKRKFVPECKRVYSNGCGYVITDKDIVTDDGGSMPFSKYGCTYEEWLNGVTPRPIEFLDCPNHYTGWDRPCKGCEDLSLGEHFKNCPHYVNVEQCWQEFYKGENDGSNSTTDTNANS